MYAKLAFRNMRRSLRDYGIYFATLVIGVCVFYAFNSVTHQDVMERLYGTSTSTLIAALSIFLAVVLGFLVIYANRFLIQRRKKEFAIYFILGMKRSQVSRILVIETLLVGFISLLLGMLLGFLLSQVLVIVTAALFEVKMDAFTLFFSPDACILTVVCFAVMFLVSLLFEAVSISHCKLIDLINATRAGEKPTLRNVPLSIVLMVVAIACIGIAYRLLQENGLNTLGPLFWAATALVCLGTFLFFYSLSGMLLLFVNGHATSRLKGLRMFTLRQLSSRINTAWVSISFVCLVLFLALTSVCAGFSIVQGLNQSVDASTVYDASFTSYFGSAYLDDTATSGSSSSNGSTSSEGATSSGKSDTQKSEVYKSDTQKAAEADGYDMMKAFSRDVEGWDDLIAKSGQIDYYQGDVTTQDIYEATDYKAPSGSPVSYWANPSSINVVSLSSLNAVRALSGLDPVTLPDDGYLVWCDSSSMQDFWKAYESQNDSLVLFGTTLHPAEPGIDGTSTQTSSMNENSGIIVVPDSVIPSSSPILETVLDVMYNGSRDEVEPKLQTALKAAYGNGSNNQVASSPNGWPLLQSATATEMRTQTVSLSAIVSYLAIYIGIVLLITCAAILALQQLSEAADNVVRYDLIGKLGAERHMVNRALFSQIGVYFVFPLLLALCHSICAMGVITSTVQMLLAFDIVKPLLQTTLLAVIVYGGYYLITCSIAKGMIRQKQ